jgi:hypothetical protein
MQTERCFFDGDGEWVVTLEWKPAKKGKANENLSLVGGYKSV